MKRRVHIIDRGADGKAKRWKTSDQFGIDASARQMTPEGFMIVPGKIARTGIQEYGAMELGIEGTDRMVRLYRPADEVFKPATLASFENQSIATGHPQGDVTADNYRAVTSGCVYDVKQNPDGKHVDATLKFMDGDAIQRCVGGQDQLSCGYSFSLDMTPGISPDGEAYDGVMRDIVGNHVAHVWNARGGPGLRVADTKTKHRRSHMHTIIINGIRIELADETPASSVSTIEREVKSLADGVSAANTARDAAVTEATAAKAALDAATKANATAKTEHDAKVAELTAQIVTGDALEKLVAERTKVVTDAKAILGDDFDGEGKTVAAILVEALEHIVGAKDESPVKAAVTAILAGTEPTKSKPEIAKLAFDGAVGVLAAGGSSATRGTASDAAARAFAPAARGAAGTSKKLSGAALFNYRQNHGGKSPPNHGAA